MKIDGLEIGNGQPCRTVAEISCNHGGDLDRALRLIDAAKEAGADFLKMQCYTPDELVTLRGDGPAPDPWGKEGWTMRRLYEKARTPLNWFPGLATHCEKVGIPWFASVFGLGSLTLMEALGCPAYKLASLDYSARKLRLTVEATGKPIIRSCPKERAPVGVAYTDSLMVYCPPGYPQNDLHLENIRNRYDGFSYHGTDWLVPVYAVMCGAKLVEAHIQLDDEPSELEANVSLTASQFAKMVAAIRRAEEMVA